MPKELSGHVFNSTVIVDGSHIHLFWESRSDDDQDTPLWHLRVNIAGIRPAPIEKPTVLGRIRWASGESYRAILRNGSLGAVWNSEDGMVYRRWDRAREQWGTPEILTTARTAMTPVVFPERDIAFWVDSAPADLAPLYAAATQPDSRSETERAAEFMSRLHSSRHYVSVAKRAPGNKPAWSTTHDVLGRSGEDIDGFEVVVFEDKDGSFSIFATSPPESRPGERLRHIVYTPETGTSTLRHTWRSAEDAACFSVFRLAGGSRYCVFWIDVPDAEAGTHRLFCSFSDAPERVFSLSRDDHEYARGDPAAAFRSVSGDDRGLAVWWAFPAVMKRSVLASRFSEGRWTVPAPVDLPSRPSCMKLTGEDSGLFCFLDERSISLMPFKVDWQATLPTVPTTQPITTSSRPS